MSHFAIYISAGIGNTVFLIPLIKELNQRGRVTAIVDTPYSSEELLNSAEPNLIDNFIYLSNISGKLALALRSFDKFDTIFLDYFSASKRRMILSHFVGKQIITNKIPDGLSNYFKNKIVFIEPKRDYHEAAQYLRFIDLEAKDTTLSESSFSILKSRDKQNVISIQPGAGNSKTPWKIWPLDKWIILTQQICRDFPNLTIIVFGDETEAHLAPYFQQISDKIIVRIGQTSVAELPELLSRSKLHIGGDSGLTHIAGSVGTRTVTISGGSDPNLFGWHKIDSTKHIIIENKLTCHPCYRWYLPNRSRVSHASKCPDFKCIRDIDVDSVYNHIQKQLSLDVS